MAGWKDQLRSVYNKLQKDQKNKKGFQNKFNNVIGYKNKKGFSSTGIPLTSEAAIKLRKNKATYRGRYAGSALERINEQRKADGKRRWEHSGAARSTDTAPNKSNHLSVSEMRWRSSERKDGFSSQPAPFVGYGYGDRPTDDGSVEIDVGFYKERPAPISGVDENKFPRIAEAIRNLKNGKR
jgi:hypothetical protein